MSALWWWCKVTGGAIGYAPNGVLWLDELWEWEWLLEESPVKTETKDKQAHKIQLNFVLTIQKDC